MRGTGFEPADPYGTAPSTLRRWPSLATHALACTFELHSNLGEGPLYVSRFDSAACFVDEIWAYTIDEI